MAAGLIFDLLKYAAITTAAGIALFHTSKRAYYDVEGGRRAVIFNCFTGTKKKVQIGVRVLAHPLPDRSIANNPSYDELVLNSIVQETLLAVVALYSEIVSRGIRNLLTASFHLAVDDVSITNLTFSKEFIAAIEAKQIAAQEAEKAKFIVEKAEQDKKSAIIRAQGEAQSALLIGEAIKNNTAFIALRRIEASREIAKTVSKSKNRVLLNTDDLLLNVQAI